MLQTPIELEQRADPSGKPEQHARVNIVRADFSKNFLQRKTIAVHSICTVEINFELKKFKSSNFD